jgi:hypothetical protein
MFFLALVILFIVGAIAVRLGVDTKCKKCGKWFSTKVINHTDLGQVLLDDDYTTYVKRVRCRRCHQEYDRRYKNPPIQESTGS